MHGGETNDAHSTCHAKARMNLERKAKAGAIARVEDEFTALTEDAGLLDLSCRSRLCLLGEDRTKFLHGQVTNDINGLAEHTGCYAALVNAKGKMESDLFIYRLADEILLDFEPNLTEAVKTRLEKYIIAEDVEIADVAPHFGLLSIQGPKAAVVLKDLGIPEPKDKLGIATGPNEEYVINQPRLGTTGFDLFAPIGELKIWKTRLAQHALPCSEKAFEKARVLSSIPRFGKDLTEANLPPEGGLESCAISYTKGCYIGQEIIARIRTYGQVAKALRGLKLDGPAAEGDAVFRKDKQVGMLSSVITQPDMALALIRREANDLGNTLCVKTKNGDVSAVVATLPFEKFGL